MQLAGLRDLGNVTLVAETITLQDSKREPMLIVAGTAVYAQVDSANAGSDYGAVLELYEILGLPYNNILGPVFITEPTSLTTETAVSATPDLPPRPTV